MIRDRNLELELLRLPCGSVLIARTTEEKLQLQHYAKIKLVEEVLPSIFYKPYKRKTKIEGKMVIKIAQLYMKVVFPHAFIAKGAMAAHHFRYQICQGKDLEFYAPVYQNQSYRVDDYTIHILRKDKKSYLYSLGAAAEVIEVFRYIGPYSCSEEVRKKIAQLIKKKHLSQLLKKEEVPKWIRTQLARIQKIKEKI